MISNSGFAGKTPTEKALVDAFFELYREYNNAARNYFYVARGMREGNKVGETCSFRNLGTKIIHIAVTNTKVS